MEECFLTEEHQAKPEQMCEVACQDPGKINVKILLLIAVLL